MLHRQMISMSKCCMSHLLLPQKHLRDPKIIEATTAMATQTTSDVDTWHGLANWHLCNHCTCATCATIDVETWNLWLVALRQTIWLDCSVLGCHRRVGNKGLYTTPCCWEITYGYRTCWCCCTPISISDY